MKLYNKRKNYDRSFAIKFYKAWALRILNVTTLSDLQLLINKENDR